MKAFQFRLETALRWRSAQLRLQRESVSSAAGTVNAIQRELDAARTEFGVATRELTKTSGNALDFWPAFSDRCRRRIQALSESRAKATRALAEETGKMIAAHQRVRILENLRRDQYADWTNELNRETDAFAAEAFLARFARESRSSSALELRSGRARSSSG